jgi:hypothetical protein
MLDMERLAPNATPMPQSDLISAIFVAPILFRAVKNFSG